MKVYLAGPYPRRKVLRAYASHLEYLGHTITSRWLAPIPHDEGEASTMTIEEAAKYATRDLEDIFEANCIIGFPREPGSYGVESHGGMHIEMGYALAIGLRVIVVGNRSNVFYSLPQIEFFETWDDCLEEMVASLGLRGRPIPHG